MRALALVSVFLAVPGLARAECTASPSGRFSYDVRLSPRAGRVCLHIVDVHSGGACDRLQASIELSCGETRRMILTDSGHLVSILAPRADRRDWNIVRASQPSGSSAWIRLGELPGIETLRGSVRLDFDGGSLRMRAGTDVRQVDLATLESIAVPRMRPSR